MASEKTTGIVLRLVDFSETSVIATLMTRDFGKISAIAKGARRRKSPFEAALDVLAICRIVFLHKTSGALSLLTEAKLERRFRSAGKNLNRLYVGYYVVELLNTLTDEGDPHPELFDLAVAFLERIDSGDFDDEELNVNLLRFELTTLEMLGHKPMLTKCVSCGREKTRLTRVGFGLNSGGVLCKACRPGQSNIVSLSPGGLEVLLNIVGGQIGANEANSDNWNQPGRESEKSDPNWSNGNPELESGTPETVPLGEARNLVNKYITHLLGYPPKLHKYLNL